jgi:hypothetical protein
VTAGGGPVVREMGYSIDEFARVLPAAMRDWQVDGAPGRWSVRSRGTALATVVLKPLPPRRIGMLSIPVAEVSILFAVDEPALVAEFMTRFERGFHRGGG